MGARKIENKIIDLACKINDLSFETESAQTSKVVKKNRRLIGILSKEKEKYENQYIAENVKDLFYLGVGVDLDQVQKGNKIVAIPWGDIENHSIILGTTRMGKTKGMLNYVRQNIMRGDNVAIVDPKGGVGQEVLNCVLEYASSSNRLEDFVYINPAETSSSTLFNPLYGMEDEEIASLIGELIYPTTNPDNEFYLKYAMTIIKQILCAISFLDALNDPNGEIKKQAEIYELRRIQYNDTSLLLKDDVRKVFFKEILDNEYSARTKGDFGFVRALVTFKDIAHFMIADNLQYLISLVKHSVIDVTREDYRKLVTMKNDALAIFSATEKIPEDHHQKIAMSLMNWTNSFSTGVFYELFCSVRINPIVQKLYDKKDNTGIPNGLIAVIQPLPLRYKKIAEDVNKIILKMLQTAYGVVSHGGRKLGKKRLFLHLDEGESSLYIGIESVLNKLAGLGVTANIYTQSFADIDAKLGSDVSKIAQDSLNTYFIMKTNDPTSVERSIALFGTRRETKASFIQGHGQISASYSPTMENLITSEEIIKLPPACCFFRNRGRRYKLYFPYVSGEIHFEAVISKSALELSYNLLNEYAQLQAG